MAINKQITEGLQLLLRDAQERQLELERQLTEMAAQLRRHQETINRLTDLLQQHNIAFPP